MIIYDSFSYFKLYALDKHLAQHEEHLTSVSFDKNGSIGTILNLPTTKK